MSIFYLTMAGSMRWPLLEPLRDRLADEQGTLRKQARARIALCYPSPYHVGMSSLGFPDHLPRDPRARRAAPPSAPSCPTTSRRGAGAAAALHLRDAAAARRSFPCSPSRSPTSSSSPASSRCSSSPAFPSLREERDERHPLVVCGGPLTFSNPVPLAPFADVIVHGRGGRADPRRCCDAAAARPAHASAARAPRAAARLPCARPVGTRCPRSPRRRRPAAGALADPDSAHRAALDVPIEPERGCSRGCPYCVMRRTTNGGMRTVRPSGCWS